MATLKVPLRYLPPNLSRKDRIMQKKMLLKSRKMYKQNKYYTRKQVASYKSKPSNHVLTAKKLYDVDHIVPGPSLAKKTGCSIAALNKIVNKGRGAYYSSGSRPNQTADSWGYARLASAITSGKSAAVDFNIIEDGCDHKKPAYKLATKAKKKYGYGHGKTRKTSISR
jgi:hypothetical protein